MTFQTFGAGRAVTKVLDVMQNVKYYVNVVMRDADGNTAAYNGNANTYVFKRVEAAVSNEIQIISASIAGGLLAAIGVGVCKAKYMAAKARNPLLKAGTFLNPFKSNAPTRTKRKEKKKGDDGKKKKKTRKFGRGGMRRR